MSAERRRSPPSPPPDPGWPPSVRSSARCGGCQYQHLAYDDQLALKTDADSRACSRAAGGRRRGLRPLPAPYGYRSKMTPHFAAPAPGPRTGHRLPARGARARPSTSPPARSRRRRVNARLTELRAEVRGALVRRIARGATLLVREASSGVHRRSARRRHRAGGRPDAAVPGRRFLPEQPVPAPAPGRGTSPHEARPAARASWSTPTAAAACSRSPPPRASSACWASR